MNHDDHDEDDFDMEEFFANWQPMESGSKQDFLDAFHETMEHLLVLDELTKPLKDPNKAN